MKMGRSRMNSSMALRLPNMKLITMKKKAPESIAQEWVSRHPGQKVAFYRCIVDTVSVWARDDSPTRFWMPWGPLFTL
jgi:hypothetical protein